MEQIYTIIINETFEECEKEELACPFCRIRDKFEKNELDLILGASKMEPSVRIKTNALGFCRDHYGKMLRAGKKLPVALLLESHFAEVTENVKTGGLFPSKSAKGSANYIEKLSQTCYVCGRIESNFEKMLGNAVYMWQSDADFKRLFAKQKCFCLPHYSAILKAAAAGMRSGDLRSFMSSARNIEERYLKKVSDDLAFFIKKFDYRYADEPWGDAKDAVEKTIAAITGQQETPRS